MRPLTAFDSASLHQRNKSYKPMARTRLTSSLFFLFNSPTRRASTGKTSFDTRCIDVLHGSGSDPNSTDEITKQRNGARARQPKAPQLYVRAGGIDAVLISQFYCWKQHRESNP